jgi:peptidoglycan LD-endopeptidase LytH
MGLRPLPFLLAIALTACDSIELPLSDPPATPHAAYAGALRDAGLHETALGREWLGASIAALRSPTRVLLPIAESGYFPNDRPRAIAFQVNLTRGRRLVLNADLTPAPGAILFIDIFSVPQSEGDSLQHVISADSGTRQLQWEPRRTGDYVIRLQPELLRGGRYSLTLRNEPALAFPVLGAQNQAMQSGFGAPRDGGARDHHGIDIFAPRGTPVLAAARGTTMRVNETARGGRVVWVRDERRGISLYYAHLDRQLVDDGVLVEIGDTLGWVGNTGNARTTPPHLHFGVYRRGEGPLDPWPWVARMSAQPAPVRADTSLLGQWVRTVRPTALRAAASTDGPVMRSLEAQTVMRSFSARGSWFGVTLPDGAQGFVLASDASAVRPLPVQLTSSTRLVAGVGAFAPLIAVLQAGEVDVLGRFGELLFVRRDSLMGWIKAADSAGAHRLRP